VDRLQAFLLGLGHGFAFVGRQYHFEVDGDDFYIDLLFFNWAQSRFVIELKIGRFAPEHAGKLGFNVAWVDENLRVPDRHSPTVGILIWAGRNDNVVRYSLAGSTAPLAIANYTYDALLPAVRDAVPTDDDLTDALRADDPARRPAAGVAPPSTRAGRRLRQIRRCPTPVRRSTGGPARAHPPRWTAAERRRGEPGKLPLPAVRRTGQSLGTHLPAAVHPVRLLHLLHRAAPPRGVRLGVATGEAGAAPSSAHQRSGRAGRYRSVPG